MKSLNVQTVKISYEELGEVAVVFCQNKVSQIWIKCSFCNSELLKILGTP
ncbi:unnamed protein product [Moneuplotes crassus]|uniref:Uncharacterized protein n=1 Tax=Euplotes crassus TaxID=5936 RepID=A0AAD1XRH2_EUPCR|nr:unnamed protein product [Moneuplotes crassus]